MRELELRFIMLAVGSFFEFYAFYAFYAWWLLGSYLTNQQIHSLSLIIWKLKQRMHPAKQHMHVIQHGPKFIFIMIPGHLTT
jgi:hypothetical protein